MISSNNRVLLHLLLIDGIGVAGTHKILHFLLNKQAIPGLFDFVTGARIELPEHQLDLTVCYRMTANDWLHVGFNRDKIQLLVTGLQATDYLDKEISLLEKNPDVSFVTLLDEQYPTALRHIHMAPPVLYVRGTLQAQHPKRLAVIGARVADDYAQQVTNTLVPPLVAAGWQIVSGGARGADTMAHRAAVNAGGQTIAVLGSGLLHLYPTSNIPLFKAIVERGGAVISCFRLEMSPEQHNFPVRNRIISGLSGGCLVVQAAAKSGASITAEFALEQGRQVFAVPGSIFHPLSEGTHKLLGMGAKAVTKVSDILEEFGDVADEKLVQQSIVTATSAVMVRDTSFLTTNGLVNLARPEELRRSFSGDERLEEFERPQESNPILQALHESISIDQLSVKTGLDVIDLQDKLFMLQLEGKAQQTFSGLWERVSL